MATVNELNEAAARDNALANTLEENAKQFNLEAADARAQTQVGESLERALTQDAEKIELKADQLSRDIANMVSQQTQLVNQEKEKVIVESRVMVDKKATTVLEKATKMVNDLRKEITTRLNNVRSPLTGELISFEDLFSWMFVFHKENVYTAEEYDNLGQLAALYDQVELQAYNYDFDNKTYLKKFSGSLNPLTATEYDTLQLTCSKFATFNLNTANYDLFGKALLH